MRTNLRLLAAACAATTLPVLATVAMAANDHLRCYKIKDVATFESATAELEALVSEFGLETCTIKPKAKLWCTPVTKTVTSLEGGTPVDVEGDEQSFSRLCYSVKCPKGDIADLEVSDQFGTRTVGGFKSSTLCTPAVVGPPPTTTTTSTTLACIDTDNDGYGANCSLGPDCNDASNAVNPMATESCNGIDDDCDDATDEGNPGGGAPCATGLAGVCASGTTTCSSGAIVCDQDTDSGAESCNNLDDDCDNATDEGVSQSCYTGPGGTAGVGSCVAGTQSCSAGSFGACVGQTLPSTETCNNVDEDCDGVVDDGLTRGCYTGPGGTSGVGVCRSGTQTCSAGSWGGTCPGQVIPSVETCGDGLDNDCDGSTDEGC